MVYGKRWFMTCHWFCWWIALFLLDNISGMAFFWPVPASQKLVTLKRLQLFSLKEG